jgi:tetratricopeptide (TPR) repeat protein
MKSKIYIVFIIASVISCSSCFDRYEQRDKFYKLAHDCYENNQLEDSLVHIKNALRIDPKFVSGYLLLGDIAFKNNNFSVSNDHYHKAFDIEPTSVEANMGLAKSHIFLNQDQEASKYIKNILKIDSLNTEVKFFQGILFFREQRFEDSLKILNEIPQSDLSSEWYVLIAQNHLRLDDIESAIKCLSAGIDSISDNKKNYSLHLDIAKIYELKKDLDAAAHHYKYVYTHGQQTDTYRYVLADFYLRNGFYNEAKEVLYELITNVYDINALNTLIAFLIKEGNSQQAEDVTLNYLKQHPDKTDLKLFLANFYIQQKQFVKARNALEKELLSESSLALKNKYRKLLVNIFKMTHENGKIHDYMTRILKDDPSDCDALMYFANKDALNGNFDQAIFTFRQVIHLEADKDRSYLALAQLYLARSDLVMARQVLFECIQNSRSSSARILLAKIFEEDNQLTNAIDQLRMVPDVFKTRSDLFRHLVQLEIKNRNFSQVEKDLLAVLDHKPYEYFSRLTLSKLYSSQGFFDKAHHMIDQAIETDKTQIPFYEQKISIFFDQQNIAGAHQFIDNHVADESVRYFLQGELLLTINNDVNKALTMFKKSLDINGNRYLTMKLLHMYIQNDQTLQAIDVAKRYVESHDSDAQILFLLGYLYEMSGEYQYAITSYKRSLQSNPSYFPAVNNLAYLYAEKFPTRSNLEYALDLIEQGLFVMNSQSLDTLGWVYSQLGEIDHSLAIFETLATWPDVSPVVFYHLGATYMRAGQAQRAREWLTKSVNAQSDFPEKEIARKLLNEIAG